MTFRILDHIERLTILKELISEYVCECPVCNGHRLTISKSTGAYSCWTTECPPADIREAIAPIGWQKQCDRSAEAKPKPAIIYGRVELARFRAPVKANLERQTWYEYTQSCRVHRYYDQGEKYTIPYFNGQRGKGDRLWLPYKIDEVEVNAWGKWVLGVEGEKCVEYARELGLVALTWQGSSWTQEDFIATIYYLRNNGIRGICYYPDLDVPGFRKAYKLWQTCAKPLLQQNKFPLVVVDPSLIWSGCPEGGDIADWCETGLADPQRIEDVANRQGSDMVEKQKFLPF